MHSTYSQTTHFGTQPIRVLQHNITDQLEKIDSCFLEKLTRLVESKGLDPGIKYSAEEEPIRDDEGSHVANISADGEMELHETYLSYLWCLSFATLTLFEEVNLKPRLKATSNKPSLRHVKNAENLFYYAMSLRTKFSPWDKELPNPKTFCEEDRTYIEKANGLFLWAVVWVLCHEIAHANLGHLAELKAGNYVPKVDAIEQERRADAEALNDVIRIGKSDVAYTTRRAGSIVGLISLLLLSKNPEMERHPDSDDRLKDALGQLNLDPLNHIWGIAAMGLKLWDQYYGAKLYWPDRAATFKELFECLATQISSRKGRADRGNFGC